VDLDPVSAGDEAELTGLIEAHVRATGSAVGARLLAAKPHIRRRFVKVMPREYKKVLARGIE
jgi:glutamate synthase (NADPH/NADH) large chain